MLKVRTFCYIIWTATALLALLSFPIDKLTTAPLEFDLFSFLNPIGIGTAVAVLISYSSGVIDMWRNRDGPISPAHMLSFGILVNWTGFLIRATRWYLFAGDAPHSYFIATNQPWVYDIGAWLTIIGGMCMVAALELMDRKRRYRLFVLTGVTVGITVGIFLYFAAATPISVEQIEYLQRCVNYLSM